MKTFRLLDSIKNGLWFVPVVCVVAGVALSVVTVAVDRSTDFELIPQSFTGGPDIAIAILSTVAASMVSLAALVLTITMVVVQLAMGQFSPRIVQTFLQDKPSQIAIGLFVATFAHAIVALREVDVDKGNVPGLAIVVAFLLVLVSIVVLVLYVHHIGRSLRVASLMELVGEQTRKLLDQVYPDHGPEMEDGATPTIAARKSGVINHIEFEKLVDLAAVADCTLELLPSLGEFVPAGAPVFLVHGEPTDLDEGAVVNEVVLGLERTLDQDVAYGLRMLVDIAERSLSDSPFQDPTTAVQAIDRLHDCLRQLARRPFPDGMYRDDAGDVRLITPVMDWNGYVHLAFDEIRMAGAASPQVTRRLQAALEDLKAVALPDRRPVLDSQLELLASSTRDVVTDPHDVTMALSADRLGFGVRANVASFADDAESS
ncbi:MAG: DUF2254 domain-containing protein [Geodermatophilaceae bacterium]|nr:DUF2254 domain-containing protein [Geodermatophilaceae bacterium]